MQIKHPVNDFNDQTMILMDSDNKYWKIKVSIEDVTEAFVKKKVLPDCEAEYFLGLNAKN